MSNPVSEAEYNKAIRAGHDAATALMHLTALLIDAENELRSASVLIVQRARTDDERDAILHIIAARKAIEQARKRLIADPDRRG